MFYASEKTMLSERPSPTRALRVLGLLAAQEGVAAKAGKD